MGSAGWVDAERGLEEDEVGWEERIRAVLVKQAWER